MRNNDDALPSYSGAGFDALWEHDYKKDDERKSGSDEKTKRDEDLPKSKAGSSGDSGLNSSKLPSEGENKGPETDSDAGR